MSSNTRSIRLLSPDPNHREVTVQVSVGSETTVADLKAVVQAEHPAHPMISQQRLAYRGQMLNDEDKLSSVLSMTDRDDAPTLHLFMMGRPQAATPRQSIPSPVSPTQNNAAPQQAGAGQPASPQHNYQAAYSQYSQYYYAYYHHLQRYGAPPSYDQLAQQLRYRGPPASTAQQWAPPAAGPNAAAADNLANAPMANVREPADNGRFAQAGLGAEPVNDEFEAPHRGVLGIFGLMFKLWLLIMVFGEHMTGTRYYILLTCAAVAFLHQLGLFAFIRSLFPQPAAPPAGQRPHAQAQADNQAEAAPSDATRQDTPDTLPAEEPRSLLGEIRTIVSGLVMSLVPA